MPSGWCFVASPDVTLLQSARAAGIRLPSSCRNGTCRACICQLLQGEIRYRMEWPGLSREEKLEGWVLPCVAYPVADIVLAAPAAERNEG
ncbi:2Fe-2S iron-sulfur cluster-binding protein [Schlegelella sp. S2-27]|uniref:2Fe-2S iron-sulfur cluster-binding protein n=1 Tax=Caldimonas mangrovi TaxID=2944811 RepID=A0ABT0YHH9_9BURK|nr:2Fe-2S iron-sulfur cluster-binding protein [Caldimonas mangrovi]MCM5678148.1 2Fe-2S iron-sulfur cluster-binding protein [Caldimonas mangrovi]